MLDNLQLNNAMSFEQYAEFVASCAGQGITSGPEQLEERIQATVLNAQRIKRISKQAEISKEIVEELSHSDCKWTWIMILESWCGDGAQNSPVIAKIAGLAQHINLKVVLRDENPELMDRYLTNGSRSIPKLICFDSVTGQELGVWGPRPKAMQEWVLQFKKDNPGVPHDEFVKNLHSRYATDKTVSLQTDLLDFIHSCKERCSAMEYMHA